MDWPYVMPARTTSSEMLIVRPPGATGGQGIVEERNGEPGMSSHTSPTILRYLWKVTRIVYICVEFSINHFTCIIILQSYMYKVERHTDMESYRYGVMKIWSHEDMES